MRDGSGVVGSGVRNGKLSGGSAWGDVLGYCTSRVRASCAAHAVAPSLPPCRGRPLTCPSRADQNPLLCSTLQQAPTCTEQRCRRCCCSAAVGTFFLSCAGSSPSRGCLRPVRRSCGAVRERWCTAVSQACAKKAEAGRGDRAGGRSGRGSGVPPGCKSYRGLPLGQRGGNVRLQGPGAPGTASGQIWPSSLPRRGAQAAPEAAAGPDLLGGGP